jgi:Carboxypeptidase regulatory-like domain/TonB dependent receptor
MESNFVTVFSRRNALACVLVVSVLLVVSGAAQTVITGDLTGTVTDPSGAVVSGANVSIVSLAEGTTQTTTSNSTGLFRVPFVKPGDYKVTISAKGFKSVAQKVTVAAGQIATFNGKLELGTSSEVIEVSGTTPLLQTENGDTQTSYSQLQLATLPAPGGDTTSYAYTAPGVVVSNGGGYGNFSSFGLPSTSNLFTVNGNDNMDPFLNLNNSGASNLTLGANELQEISVVANGYTAQYGRQSGAQVNSVTKSGSNGFHGNAFYGYNGTNLNANDWFSNALGSPRPHAVNNNYYASVGGPIIKNKLFFFADYEALRMVLPGVSGVNTVPTSAFSTFVQNTVPTGAQSFYQNILGLYAGAPGSANATPIPVTSDPNLGCGDFSQDFDGLGETNPQALAAGFGNLGTFANPIPGKPCAATFSSNANNLITEWILATRVDYKISSTDTLFGRYHMDRGVQATGTDPIDPVFNATSIQPEYDGQLNETHIFNPTTINNFIFSAQWYKALFGPPSFAAAIAKFPTTLIFGGSASTFTQLGGSDNAYPQGRIPTQYQITDDFSKTIGGHDIKVGLNFRRDLVSDYSALAGTSGALNILTTSEFVNGVTDPASSFYNANYANVGAVRVKYYSLGAYLQDQWRVSSKLSLTLALRIDRNSNPTCDKCFVRMQGPFQSVTHDSAVPYNATIQTGLSSAFSSVEKAVFSPRFGFAYSLNPNTVIRGGFGIFDDLFPATAVDRFITNAPGVSNFSSSGAAGELLAPGAGGVFEDANSVNAAFQAGFASGLTLADLGGPGLGPNYYTMGNKLNNPKFAEWNLEVQRQIGSKYSVGLNYVGNHGYDELNVNTWLNAYCKACAAGETFAGTIGSTATDQRFNEVVDLNNAAYSNYHGMTAEVKVRPTHGISGQFSYTWSHGLDTCSNNCLEPFVITSQGQASFRYQSSPFLPGSAYGNSDYDVRHNFNLNYVYQSPSAWSSPLMTRLMSGWTVAGTLFYHTGIPWSPVDSAKRNALGNVLGLRTTTPLATFAGAVTQGSCGESAAKAGASIGGTPCGSITQYTVGADDFGNSRNQLRGAGFFNTDLSLTKNFKIGERLGFAVGATAFNILNHQNFEIPINSIRSGAFGQVKATVGSNTSPYGAFFGVPLNGRILQVTGKVTF